VTVVVADTSVYVSALVFGGVPLAALIKALTVPSLSNNRLFLSERYALVGPVGFPILQT
jgi:hypothetical protein